MAVVEMNLMSPRRQRISVLITNPNCFKGSQNSPSKNANDGVTDDGPFAAAVEVVETRFGGVEPLILFQNPT